MDANVKYVVGVLAVFATVALTLLTLSPYVALASMIGAMLLLRW